MSAWIIRAVGFLIIFCLIAPVPPASAQSRGSKFAAGAAVAIIGGILLDNALKKNKKKKVKRAYVKPPRAKVERAESVSKDVKSDIDVKADSSGSQRAATRMPSASGD